MTATTQPQTTEISAMVEQDRTAQGVAESRENPGAGAHQSFRAPQAPAAVAHEHAWRIASRHRTSQGWIAYVSCTECGGWSVRSLGALGS